MALHDYAIFGQNRATISRWLGVASAILTGAISGLLVWIYLSTNWQAISTAVAAPAIIYFLFHFLFNKYGWKIPLFSIPNIAGVWAANGKTLNEEGSTRYEWNAEIDIEQTWENICITLKTSQSSSNYLPLALLENIRAHLLLLVYLEVNRSSLLVPDGARKVFYSDAKIEALNILYQEVDGLAKATHNAIAPYQTTYDGHQLKSRQIVFF